MKDTTIKMGPNELLKYERQRRGWTRLYVAEQIGVADPKTIGRWELGRCRPSAYFLQKLCDLFDMLPADLGFAFPDSERSSATHLPRAHSVTTALSESGEQERFPAVMKRSSFEKAIADYIDYDGLKHYIEQHLSAPLEQKPVAIQHTVSPIQNVLLIVVPLS